MSYFQNQISSFNSSVKSAATRLPQDRRAAGSILAAAGSSSIAAAASTQANSSAASAANGRRHDADTVYSQPVNTGTGKDIMTQVVFAIDHMKSKDYSLKFSDILSYLSLHQQGHDPGYIQALKRILQSHEKVQYDPSGANGEGTFRFKPPHDIRTAEQLLRKLQSQPTAQGMSVRELREGWPTIVQTIDKLEKEGKLLVTRNKKDDHPKMVWANDPSLIQHFDPEFRAIWEKIKIPDQQTVTEELEKAGITPTSKNKVVKPRPKVENKKVKKARRSGKTTNTHMTGILRDYSHLKR
ncbi:transcription initiation factor IIE subunit beta [Paracoccidioides lutzii Pb01]|uniref:Transcription initiation factor IIE subunit beta n=1 Tax=Paracoccidioides lutzii (strain ATCC MYA-826 / Pb01) TaxID=502779 RepID=C1H2I9_PARBA|nr:transcription initiation factor IIE subunit beta [Paracoccidioides lutzii Pb01]EEH33933.1 transcription initiation factor IIE subunit beta [Paracoccidioides lutzii Pb01]